nr:hypothetical protein [Tanacetum cinerariifolium]
MRCTIQDSQRSSYITSCRRIRPFQGGTRNSKAYKEYYAIATGEATPKPKASARRTRSGSDTSVTPPTTAETSRPTAATKGKQTAKASKAKSLSALSEPSGSGADEGTGSEPGVPDVPTDESEELSWNSTDDKGNDGDDDEEDDGDADEEVKGDDGEEGKEDDDEDTDGDEGDDDDEDQEQESSSVSSQFVTSMLNLTLDAVSSDVIQNLPNFGSLFHFDDRLRSLEENFFEVMQTNQFVGAVSAIPRIVQQYMDQQMNEAVQVAIQIQFDRLCDEAQRENDKFLKTVDENIKKIIKEQVKDQVKRRREGTEPESGSAPSKTATRSAGRSTIGSRSRQASASKSALADEPVQTTSQIEEPSHPEFDTGAYDQPIVQSSQHPEWFSQPQKPPTPDRDWNKTLPAGSCKSVIELEYHLEKVFKATTDQLDWVNPEGQQYPHNLLQPLPLIPNNRGRRVIPFQFINNDLEYLRAGACSRKYTTSITKTNATDYRHIKWIKDLVPRTMWFNEPIGYDKYALWGVSYWGHKRQQFYGFAVNQESTRDVYSKRRIIAVT